VAYRQRGNFHRVSGADVPDRPFLNRDDVAALGAAVQKASVQPKTVSQHLYESQPEVTAAKRPGKFVDDPFPKPDGYLGKAPWWGREREPEIRAWFERHPRRRSGDGIGGRPRKAQPNG
jgi:hypothetical protein